ncbi:hypothetical protein HDU86_003756 [Geranomyces michiganensis]|nr:hypothetical protein HDU86_003756 [Geranomyces michiganensis]
MSLQAFLEDLSSTSPVDFDPERDPTDASGPAEGSDDEGAFTEEAGADLRAHYVDVGRGSIRTRAGVELDDRKYAGKRVSRASVFEADESDEEEGEEQEEGEESEENSEDDEDDEETAAMEVDGDAGLESDEIAASSGEDDEDVSENASEGGSEDGPEAAADQVEGSSDDGEEEGSESDEDDGEQSQSNNRLAKELEQLEVEEKKLIKTMSASARADVEKGHHVRAQIVSLREDSENTPPEPPLTLLCVQTLWDGLLDSRIRIQRAVTVANRLPKPDLYSAFEASSSDSQTAINDASQELVALVDDLIDLRTALISQNPAVQPLYAEGSPLTISPFSGEEVRSLKRKRDQDDPVALLEAVWADVQPLDAQFTPFRDQTIDKWNSKVQVATGIPLQKKFKAINQTVMSQINQILSDKSRLIKRSQLRRSDYLPLGQIPTDDAADPGAQSNDTADAHLANYDEEIFDDGDYYQQLLKELIENRITDADDAVLNGLKWAHFKSLKNKDKKKKRVDTKASKGRKIRFHVHEKLQNYMAPEPRGNWHDAMVDKLFGALLGQGVEHAAVVEQSVEEPAADGFRIM